MTDTGEAETNPVVRLVTLGSAHLLAASPGSSSSAILRPGKPLALLIYLAALPVRTASREHLINLLWADADPERGLRTLRQTIFQLRQLLGDNSIIAKGRDLCLDLSLQFDRDEFLAAVTEGDNDKAVSLYTGPFLADFGVPGGAEFEHWADRERDRLQSAYTRSAESVIRYRLDHAHYDSAIREARRLRDFDRDREASWRLLLESLSSSGDYVSAITEAEDLERFLRSEDRDPENLTRSAITRAKRAQAPASAEEAASSRLVAELTGRDREFSRLTSMWSIVKSGRFRHVHITAPPGIGKTRLLRDVYTRLRASGARAMWLSAFAGDRRLAYALVSDIVGKAGTLSGASGVSTAAASSLIALNPKLSSSFASPQGRAEGEEAFRRRVHAVTELFEALADEAPIAVFIDDMHWSDTVSRQLLKSALSRIGDCRIFLVTSARTVPDGSLNLPHTESMTLEPLDEHQVGQLVTSFGSLPDDALGHVFVHALHENTGGSPLLILENLHLAMERGLLELADGQWIFSQPSSLIEAISRGDVLEQRLRKLDDRLFRILSLLAIAEEPTDTDTMASALASTRATIDADLITLEQQGLASADGELWRCAHDSIADTVVRMTPGPDQEALHAALGNSIAGRSDFETKHARAAIRHLTLAGKQDTVQQVFARAVTIARSAGDRRTNLQLAQALLGVTSQSEMASRLVSSLPLKQQVQRSTLIAIASIAAIALLAFAVVLRVQSVKPAQLAIVTQPLAANMLVVPPPVIEIDDGKGRRVRGALDTVSVETVGPSPGISGTLKVAAIDGRAEFKDVSVTGEGPLQLRFRAKGMTEVLSDSINVAGAMPTLRLVSGVVNGQPVGPQHRTIIVKPGTTVSGKLMLEYSSYWGSASVLLCAKPTWGDKTKNFLDLAPLFTPARNQPRRTQFTFEAPKTSGIYHIVFAFDAEGNVEDFMSGTNWRMPEPIWNDGNDIADWSDSQFVQANALGWTMSKFIQIDNSTGKPIVSPHPVAATVIDVIVR